MRIHLNGNVFELAPDTGVRREPIVEFPGPIRQQGQQERSQQSLMSSWEFSDFTFGSGIERMDTDQERDKASYWKSTVDTRWRGKVMLPPLLNNTTFGSTNLTNAAIGILDDDTNALLVCRVPSAANASDTCMAKFVASASRFDHWQQALSTGSLGNIERIFQVAYDRERKEYHYLASSVAAQPTAAGIHMIARQPESNVPTLLAGTRILYVASYGAWEVSAFHRHVGTLHIGVQNLTAGYHGRTYVHPIMSDNADEDTYEYNTKYFMPDYYKPPHLAHTPEGLYAGHSDGVYLLNLTQRTYTKKLDFSSSRSKHNCVEMCSWGNEYLMVPYRNRGGIGGLMAYNTVNETSIRVGMDLDDGVPSGWSTEVTSLLALPDYIMAGYSRPLGSYPDNRYGMSRVFAYDGYGWHFMVEMPTASDLTQIKQLVTSDQGGDGIPRMFIVPTGSTLSPYYINYPLSNPLIQEGYTFATEGSLRYPRFDGGMPEYKGTFLSYIIEADTLGSGRQIEVLYGLDGSVPTQSLGIATLSGTRVMNFGDGNGVEGYSVQVDLKFTRGVDNAKSPVLVAHHSPVLHYIKFPGKRETFRFTVDLGETQRGTKKAPKDSFNALLAVASTNTMVPFSYAHVPTKSVKMISMVSDVASDDYLFTGDAKGQIEVTLAELL